MARPKTKSEIDYSERVKLYVNLEGVTTRKDLYMRLVKGGMLGKVRQYRQTNIMALDLDLAVRGKPEEFKTYYREVYYKRTYEQTIYRSKKTGRFIKKPKKQ